MRRSVLVTAFVVAAALGVAFAQGHGRGRFFGPVPGFHKGFGHKGFGPGVPFGFGHGAAIGFVPGGMGFASGAGLAPPSSFIPRFSIRVGPGGGKFLGHGGFRHRFIQPGFFGGSVVVPYPVWFGDPYAYYSREQVAAAATEYVEQQRLDVELQGVKNELRALREERESARVAPPQAPKAAPAEPALPPPPEAPPTMFVMRDGRKIETRNYAIVGQTLWIFNERRATKFQIADLDVDSTTKTNAERGVDIHLPRK